jgi:hypothetical protein
MWTIFTDLRKLKTSHRVDRIFRIAGYGTILLLLCFADVVLEPPKGAAAGGYSYLAERIVITTSLAGGLVFLCLRLLQPRGAFLIQSLSPHSRRSVRAVSILSSIYFLLFIGVAYCGDLLGPGRMVFSIFPSLPLLLPLLLIVAFLSSDKLKGGLALGVATGCVLFFRNKTLLSMARAAESPWWVQIVLFMAALAGVILTCTAIWAYYTLPRENHDLRKLLHAFAYAFVVLFLFWIAQGPEDSPQVIHGRVAIMRLEEINKATSAYATRFGGVFPQDLGALGPPPRNQKADCRAAGLLQKPFSTESSGYIFQYRTGLPSSTALGGCEGATQYTITARPAAFEKTGYVNFYTDESGIIRCTLEDRLANAHDDSYDKCVYLFSRHFD